MKIDLHVHTACSDGNLPVDKVIQEASFRRIDLLSLSDHDSIECQKKAISLCEKKGINYIIGIELNVTFPHPFERGKTVSLDFLGYEFDIGNEDLKSKLKILRQRREDRAQEILERLNTELTREHIPGLDKTDIQNIQDSVDGSFGRPHIARYLVEKGIVGSVQEAFDRYLVRLDVPKFPLSLAEASTLIRNAGGILVLAHPSDPHGTSLAGITTDLNEQTKIIEEYMLEYIDGVECWHFRNDIRTTDHYIQFAKSHDLFLTGGSDCHQKPIIMGKVDIPDWVAEQFI
jgi:predicted metal-dependent phosphoesterase TrpH